MEDRVEEKVHEHFEYVDGANAFFVLVTSGGLERMSKVTNLEIVIDGSTWSDSEDDAWAIALQAFAPISKNLEHLHITIRGPVLFTRFNYIKPVLYDLVAFGCLEDSDSSDYTSTELADSSPAANSATKPANHKKAKRPEELSPDSTVTAVKYKKRIISPDRVNLHITGEKEIIRTLLNLHKPIPRITIQGYMELGLRRHLIRSLNPDWASSLHCTLQAGCGNRVPKAVEEAAKREEICLTTGASMVKIHTMGQEGEMEGAAQHFFGLGMGRGRGDTGGRGWPVCTGGAGRQVYGWKASTVHAWRGPPSVAVQRENLEGGT